MIAVWPDDLVDGVVATLRAAAPTSGITGLTAAKILDGDMLPTDMEELPVIGVYIPEDKSDNDDTNDGGYQRRIATIRVEIRGTTPAGGIRDATKALRAWVLTTLLADETLAGKALHLRFETLTFWGRSSDRRMGGADLDFQAIYIFNPEVS